MHALLEHQLRLALRGVESTLVHGPFGSGKTECVRRLIQKLEAEQLKAQLASGAQPGVILVYETSRATGPKTVLTDIYIALTGRPMGKRSRQDWTPTQFIAQIADRTVDDNVRVIAIDEAHQIDPTNLDLLRQIPDAVARRGHTLRFVLVGNAGLTQNVAATGQDGERFTGDVVFPPMAPEHVAPHLPQFHPGLGALQQALPARGWKRLELDLFTEAGGSFRRLCTLIANAHEFALKRGQAMSGGHVRLAIEKIRKQGGTRDSAVALPRGAGARVACAPRFLARDRQRTGGPIDGLRPRPPRRSRAAPVRRGGPPAHAARGAALPPRAPRRARAPPPGARPVDGHAGRAAARRFRRARRRRRRRVRRPGWRGPAHPSPVRADGPLDGA